eukprot:1180670-Prorocentrum_minimum.AAC.4
MMIQKEQLVDQHTRPAPQRYIAPRERLSPRQRSLSAPVYAISTTCKQSYSWKMRERVSWGQISDPSRAARLVPLSFEQSPDGCLRGDLSNPKRQTHSSVP